MKSRFFGILTLVVGLAMLVGNVGCVRFANTSRLDQLRSDEALAVGKLTVICRGQPATKGSNLLVRHRGTRKFKQHRLDETGLVFARLPVGEYDFDCLYAKSGLRHYPFKPGEALFTVSEPGKAYYIGHIVANWTPKKGDVGLTVAGIAAGGVLLGGLVSASMVGEMSLTVQDNLPDAQNAFREKFNTSMELIPSHLKVKPSQ